MTTNKSLENDKEQQYSSVLWTRSLSSWWWDFTLLLLHHPAALVLQLLMPYLRPTCCISLVALLLAVSDLCSLLNKASRASSVLAAEMTPLRFCWQFMIHKGSKHHKREVNLVAKYIWGSTTLPIGICTVVTQQWPLKNVQKKCIVRTCKWSRGRSFSSSLARCCTWSNATFLHHQQNITCLLSCSCCCEMHISQLYNTMLCTYTMMMVHASSETLKTESIYHLDALLSLSFSVLLVKDDITSALQKPGKNFGNSPRDSFQRDLFQPSYSSFEKQLRLWQNYIALICLLANGRNVSKGRFLSFKLYSST